ncbi:hypothetical protein KQ940_01630 [Marinobacterium sp. D7]|uniref:hypothetical protein n=1 Tax=Marinobacterium ramblicola TaxID=2849041 RepID=UPI001C2DDB62|nr:hypothetical protein [Marinobacterium ramblicola]MBV1786752.1 hypothetical protein [Marinobacterium ramblicola]
MALPKLWSNPWLNIVSRYDKGLPVYKQMVVDALESDYPVSYDAKPLLAAIISGDYGFEKPPKNLEFLSPAGCRRLIEGLEYLVHVINDCDADISAEDEDAVKLIESLRQESRSGRGSPTALALAKESIAKSYGITARTLEIIIKEFSEK